MTYFDRFLLSLVIYNMANFHGNTSLADVVFFFCVYYLVKFLFE